jgi:hypothetical protein
MLARFAIGCIPIGKTLRRKVPMHIRCIQKSISLPLFFVLLTGFAAAQIQNPIKAAKDAYNKAKQQQRQQQQTQVPPNSRSRRVNTGRFRFLR